MSRIIRAWTTVSLPIADTHQTAETNAAASQEGAFGDSHTASKNSQKIHAKTQQNKPDAARPETKSRAPAWCLLAAITLLAAALDLFQLSAQPIWFDESVSIAIAHLSTDDFVMFLTNHEPFMVLYSLLLRIWLVLGQSEFAVRSLSVIFAVAAVPSLYFVGRRLFDNRTAALAALLLAINSLFIQYAQEARSYTLTTLIVIWSWYTLLELIDRPTWGRTIYYSLVTAALAYCQILSLLMLPAQWAALNILQTPQQGPEVRFGWHCYRWYPDSADAVDIVAPSKRRG